MYSDVTHVIGLLLLFFLRVYRRTEDLEKNIEHRCELLWTGVFQTHQLVDEKSGVFLPELLVELWSDEIGVQIVMNVALLAELILTFIDFLPIAVVENLVEFPQTRIIAIVSVGIEWNTTTFDLNPGIDVVQLQVNLVLQFVVPFDFGLGDDFLVLESVLYEVYPIGLDVAHVVPLEDMECVELITGGVATEFLLDFAEDISLNSGTSIRYFLDEFLQEWDQPVDHAAGVSFDILLTLEMVELGVGVLNELRVWEEIIVVDVEYLVTFILVFRNDLIELHQNRSLRKNNFSDGVKVCLFNIVLKVNMG